MTQTVDHVALLPLYAAAGTAVAVLILDLAFARRTPVLLVAVLGSAATVAAAVAQGERSTFCVPGACSWAGGPIATLTAVVFAVLTVGVLALSTPMLRAGIAPAGEYCFLLASSMTGGVVVGYAGDLITLVVGLETLTLPLYVLVGLRRFAPGERVTTAGAEAAVTFFVVSVVSTAVALLGAALVFAATGNLHLDTMVFAGPLTPLASVGSTLIVTGFAFKVAAVPLHAWAPATYDGAPLPVAAYLSTASKLGGVVALIAVVDGVLPAERIGPLLAVLAVLTMTVGNLVALRQRRTVRLLAWSSVAQAGYILAPLGVAAVAAGRAPQAWSTAVTAALAYAVFFVVLELAAFAAVVALRRPGADGGTLAELRGAARRSPLAGAVLALALAGLAGLPPGLAGLFAKVGVIRALLGGGAGWIAAFVALNTVIALAYYVRVAAALYAPSAETGRAARAPWPVLVTLAAVAAVAVALGLAPELVLGVTTR
ncbi:MAG TPA: proton-conducting transporter membrane subunit [Actinoplanes sp.]|nr:proton-conducting transporter membrane subunit [Actinoplanes sp.]